MPCGIFRQNERIIVASTTHQRHRMRFCQPEGALEGGSRSLIRTTRKIWAEDA